MSDGSNSSFIACGRSPTTNLFFMIYTENMKHYDAIQVNNEESDALQSLPSTNPNPEDHLTPCFDCSREERPSNIFIGTFNLIASIVGGVSYF